MLDKGNFYKDVTICIIEACNLNCTYCYENHKSHRKMTFNTLKEIIDREIYNYKSDGFKGITFNLFGGEAFLYFQIIKEVVEYLESTYPQSSGYDWICFITTNGTLVHNEIQEWLITHKKSIVCGLSLDGTKKCHDLNRSNSFDLIDIDFFKKLYPEQTVKMTISQETLPYLCECVVFAHESGFKVSCNLAFNIDWSKESNEKVLYDQLMELISFYLSNPDIEPCSLLSGNLYKIAKGEKETYRECGAGQSGMCSYDVDGNKYPCQFFMPISIGNELSEKSKCIDWHDKIIPFDKLDARCHDCVLKSNCHICYGANYAATGNIFLHEENWCKLNKLTFKARAFFKIKQYEQGISLGNEFETKLTLKNALLVLEEVTI